ncbi:RING-type domain-containing protein [Hirschfeldia incana]|nr:RING-type domain-containing protein [Hirschfeldia incana]
MSSTTIGEHIRLRRARHRHNAAADDDPPLTHVVPPVSTRFCNSAMPPFSLLLPSSSNEPTKKKQLGSASFRGMNCTAATAAHEVSVPSAIRSSADWDNKNKKKKKRNKKNNNKKKKGSYNEDGSVKFLSETRDVEGGSGCVAVPDVWCGPGLGFSTDAVSVDPPRRNLPSSSRRKIDVDKNSSNQTEGSSVLTRRFTNQESHHHALMNSDSTFMTSSHVEPALFSSRYHGHLRRPYPDDLTEMMMLRNGFVMGRAADSLDHFNDLRLDVDNMSYEQLLELGDRIGYVNTGLKGSEIRRCLRKINPSVSNSLADRKCSICQDEYEREGQVGKLECGHSFHVQCVKQWLSRKNACPVCKKTAYAKP